MKQGDCRGEPGGCCVWEGWAQAGGQTAGWDTAEVGSQTSASAFQRVFRKAAGQGWTMLFLLMAAPGAPAFLQEACSACSWLCQPCLLPAQPRCPPCSLVHAPHALGIRAEIDPDLDVLLLLWYKCLPQGIISAGNYAKSIN